MVLHVRDVDDLGQPLRDESHHVGAGVFFAKEIGFEIGFRIVASVISVSVCAFRSNGLHTLG
jgi:hypothetical protein